MSKDLRARDPYAEAWWIKAMVDGIPPRPAGQPPTDEDTFDVIVVGSGMSGHVAALFLADAGCSVVMLEAASEGGGTTYKSGAGMWVPDNSLMRRKGIAPDRGWAMNHMAKLAHPEDYDPAAERLGLEQRAYELIEAYYENGAKAFDELERLGVGLMDFPSYTGDYPAMIEYHNEIDHGYGAHLSPRTPEGRWGAGFQLVKILSDLADAKGIGLRVDHRVTELLEDADGAVIGVRAATPDGDVELFGRRGVFFGTGGYVHNQKLRDEHWPGRLYGGCPVITSRGDFIELTEKLGVELENMGHGWGTQHPVELMLADGEVAEHVGVYPGDSNLMVNAGGRRVVNEKLIYHERSQVHWERDESGGYPNHLLFLIYDDFVAYDETPTINRWPDPKPGNDWVISGDTFEELAANLDARLASYGERLLDYRLAPDFAEQLAATVDRFNGFARAGVDEDFHRGEREVELDWTGPAHAGNHKNPTMFPLDDGPYHCIILAGSVLDTNGGPKASVDGKVLRADGTPIPGLYAAGNCVASAAGAGYWSGGSTLGPAATFSWLAARSLAQEPTRVVGQGAAV
jgi:succinate dehydrogenase/fumarate reductase flavoprotein subunit